MSTPQQPPPQPEPWQVRYDAQEAGRRRLAIRYGDENEQRWATDPNAPLIDAADMLQAFLRRAVVQESASSDRSRPDYLKADEMHQRPALEREDAAAAAHMIAVARADARRREGAVMRRIIAHGVSWQELAGVLDTTVEDLQTQLRMRGERPETWPTTT